MKHLRLIVLRELDHFRGWFFLLLALTAFTVLLHVLVLTIIPGMRMAEFLVIMKSYVVPGIFEILCALMGYADSPAHGSHDFRTRPVRLKSLYLGKVSVIAGTAACLVLVQVLMNAFAGFPLSFWTLWWPLFLGGLTFFFLGTIMRPEISSALQLLAIVALPWILGDWLHVFLRSRLEREIPPLGILTLTFVTALYAFVLASAKSSLRARYFWSLLLPFAALAVGAGIWLLPFNQRVVSPDKVREALSERLNPELKLTNLSSGEFRLMVSEPKSKECLLHRLSFSNHVVKLLSDDGIVRRIPMHQEFFGGLSRSEDQEILRALDLTPPLTDEAIAQRLRYDRDWGSIISGSRDFKVPPEFRGKAVEISTEGFAHYWETELLGTLPIRKGAKLTSEDLSVELVEPDRKSGYLKLRVHSRSGASIRLGAYQKNLAQPFYPYDVTVWLTSHDVTRGMSTVDILRTGVNFDHIEESQEAGTLHFFSITYRGRLPFQSKPIVLTAEQSLNKGKILRANYRILPSIIPIESK
jgi:hypothetical protein